MELFSHQCAEMPLSCLVQLRLMVLYSLGKLAAFQPSHDLLAYLLLNLKVILETIDRNLTLCDCWQKRRKIQSLQRFMRLLL